MDKPRGYHGKPLFWWCVMSGKSFAVVNRPDGASEDVAKALREAIVREGYTPDEECPGTVITVGGDGTFIYAVHRYMHCLNDVRFIGIHTGTLGFYTDYLDSEADEFLADFLKGDLPVETYPVMEAFTGQRTVYAINEIRIENPYRTQNFNVLLNDTLLERFRGTGLCVSTQLGSTAYNRSLGGAILEKGLPLFELTEMAGLHHMHAHSLNAPFVMSDDTVIRLTSDSFDKAILGADADVLDLSKENEVVIRKAPDRKLHILGGKKISYFDRLSRLT